jgi:hypothetical protein
MLTFKSTTYPLAETILDSAYERITILKGLQSNYNYSSLATSHSQRRRNMWPGDFVHYNWRQVANPGELVARDSPLGPEPSCFSEARRVSGRPHGPWDDRGFRLSARSGAPRVA